MQEQVMINIHPGDKYFDGSSVQMTVDTIDVYGPHVTNLIRKESNSQELKLIMCKSYDDDEKCFDIGFAVQMKGYNHFNRYLALLDWKEFMWEWTAKDWSFLFLNVFYKCNIKIKSLKTITWHCTHKIQRFTLESEYKQFIADLTTEAAHLRNTTFNQLEKSRKYKFDLRFAELGDFCKDISLLFDSEIWRASHLPMLYIMENERGARFGWHFIDKMRNKTKCPSHTYYVSYKASIVFDYESRTMHKGYKKYIKHRLIHALTESERTNQELMDFVQYCTSFVYYSVSLNCAPSDMNRNDNEQMNWEYNNFIYPVKMRRMYFRYWLKCQRNVIFQIWAVFGSHDLCLLPKEYKFRRNCMVCDVVQRFDDTTIEHGKNYVDKMYHCPCGLLFVCSKRCQKKAWSKKPWLHRVSCRKRRF
eukprot:429228_1